MKITNFKLGVALFFVLFVFLSNASQIDQTDSAAPDGSRFKTRREYHAFLNKLMSLHYNYRIFGEIIDPEGNIVKDVSVLSSKSKGPMADSFGQETFLIKDGKFDFFSQGVFSWGLSFEKSQYYRKTIGIGVTNVRASLEAGDAIMEGNTIVKEVKVILYPWGDLNKELLRVEHNTFYYSNENDGTQKITGVIIPYEGKKGRIRTEEEQQFTFSDEKRLPKSLIYIVPGQNKDGSPDGTIRLKTNIPDSGFVRLEYGGNHFFRNMWEAPESGYQPELVIKEDFGNSHSKSPFIVFYVKALGRYGKGFIMPNDCDSKLEKDKASLNIYLYINRNQNIRNTTIWIGTNW